jgi:hypothetical protein
VTAGRQAGERPGRSADRVSLPHTIPVPFALLPWFLAAASIFPPSSMLGDAFAALFVADITRCFRSIGSGDSRTPFDESIEGCSGPPGESTYSGAHGRDPANPNRLDRVTTMVLGAGAVFLVVALVVTFLQTS